MESFLILIAFVGFVVLAISLESPGFLVIIIAAGVWAGGVHIRDIGAKAGWWARSSASMVADAEEASDFTHRIWVDREATDIRIDANFVNKSPYWVKGVSIECRADTESGWIPIGTYTANVEIAPGGSYKLSESGGDGRSVYVTGSTCQAHYAKASEKPF